MCVDSMRLFDASLGELVVFSSCLSLFLLSTSGVVEDEKTYFTVILPSCCVIAKRDRMPKDTSKHVSD